MWGVLAIVGVVVGFVAATPLWHGPRPWLAAFPAVLGLGWFFFAVTRATRASLRPHSREQERAAGLEGEGASSHGEFVVRRKPVTRWPMIITVLFAAPTVILLLIGETPLAAAFLVFGSIVSLIAWLIAWWLGSGVIATFTPTGILLRDGEVSWHEITSLDLHFLPRIETGQIVIRLAQARAPRSLFERINSSLSAGHSDREIVLSLARSDEPAALVFHLAQTRWGQAIGSARADDALIRQFEARARKTRTWSQLSADEKSRTLKVSAAIIAVVGFAFHGVSADFRLSNDWFTTSLVLSAVLTVWGCVALLRARAFVGVRNDQGTPSYIAMVILTSLFVGVMIWWTIGQSWPDLATRVWGREVSREVTYDKTGYRNAKKCPFPLSLHLNDGRRPYRFCAEPAAFAALPAVGTLRLRLRESWFGVHIVSVSTLEK